MLNDLFVFDIIILDKIAVVIHIGELILCDRIVPRHREIAERLLIINCAGSAVISDIGDGSLSGGDVMGGYGQNIAAFYGDSDMKVRCRGISRTFHTEFKADELLDAHRFSVDKLTAEIIDALK